MSESERRRKYRYDRVLIESARVLDPQFDDAVVYLTGAQIEMLRNMTQYLNRLDTYVSEQFMGYYLAPTAEDYDSILAIVSDMEEVLMGNPNTIWGYDDRVTFNQNYVKSGDGDLQVELFEVPAGYVYKLDIVTARNATTVTTQEHTMYDGSLAFHVKTFSAQPANVFSVSDHLPMVFKEGDMYHVKFFGCLNGDVLRVRGWGSRMVVP